VNPTGPAEGRVRVVRGGSWDTYPHQARCVGRDSADPLFRAPFVGFRCARNVGK